MNPSFIAYFEKKHKEWLNNKHQDTIISQIVQDLIIRPFNLDVFLYKRETSHIPIDKTFIECLKTRDYKAIATYIILYDAPDKSTALHNSIRDHFQPTSTEQKKINSIINPAHLLSHVFHLYSKQSNLKMGKKLYVQVKPEEIEQYKTAQTTPAYKILQSVSLFNIDSDNTIALFPLKRDHHPDIQDVYWLHWEYYASFSPLWLYRIEKYHGQVDHQNKKVHFPTVEDEEDFYEEYGYEPDEQSKQTQEKSIQPLQRGLTWSAFYQTLTCNITNPKNSLS